MPYFPHDFQTQDPLEVTMAWRCTAAMFFLELHGCIFCRATVHRSWHTILKLHQPTHQWQFAVILIVYHQDNQNNYHCHHCYPPVNQHRPWQIGVGRLVSIKNWWFSIVMLNYQRVPLLASPHQHQLWLLRVLYLTHKPTPRGRSNMTALPRPVLLGHPKYVGSHEKSWDTQIPSLPSSCRLEFMGHAKEFKNPTEPMFLILFTRFINAK